MDAIDRIKVMEEQLMLETQKRNQLEQILRQIRHALSPLSPSKDPDIRALVLNVSQTLAQHQESLVTEFQTMNNRLSILEKDHETLSGVLTTLSETLQKMLQKE
jgi:tRNA C32,U32 (ribose-2'-O)-methylase TrmJ